MEPHIERPAKENKLSEGKKKTLMEKLPLLCELWEASRKKLEQDEKNHKHGADILMEPLLFEVLSLPLKNVKEWLRDIP